MPKMKKIGIVTEDYWRGGLARFTINLINNWPDKNTRFIVFTNKENTILKEHIKNQNVEYVYFNFKTVSSDMAVKRSILRKIYRQTIFKYSFFITRYFTLKSLIEKYSIDDWIVSSGGYPGSDLCRLAFIVLKSKNCLFVFHSAVQKPLFAFFLLEAFLDKIIFSVKRGKVITVSHTNKKTISNRPWLNKANIYVIHNGIVYSNTVLTKKHSSSRRIVSMISTFPQYKGHDVIIKAASYLKSGGFDLQVRFYGTDFEKFVMDIHDKIKNSEYPEIFSLPGYEEVEKVMEESDLIVLPSLNYESFGYAAAEAMGFGVPVIVSDVGGLPEVVGDSGIICKAGNVKAWAQAIKEALTDDELREMNIKKGLKRAMENFSAEVMAKKYKALLMQDGKYSVYS